MDGNSINSSKPPAQIECRNAVHISPTPVSSVSYSGCGQYVAAACQTHVTVLDVGVGANQNDAPVSQISQFRETLLQDPAVLQAVTFTPAQDQDVVMGDSHGVTRRWSPLQTEDTEHHHRVIHQHDAGITSVASCRESAIVAIGATDGMLRFETTTDENDKNTHTVRTPGGSGMTTVSVSPTGVHGGSGDQGGHCAIWDLTEGRLLRSYATERGIMSTGFSAEGRLIVHGDTAGRVRLRDIGAGEADSGQLVWHEGYVSAVMFSTNGRWIVSGGWDGCVKMWDVRNLGEAVYEAEHFVEICDVAHSTVSKMFVTGTVNGVLRIWSYP